jgi:predicted DNA-binding transcriptional regulator AlpA
MSSTFKDQLVQHNSLFQKPADRLVVSKEAKHLLGVGTTTLHKFVALKWLTPVRFSRRLVRYRASEIDSLIESFSKKGGA